MPPTSTRPSNTLEALLLEIKENKDKHAKNLKTEMTDLSLRMNKQEKVLSDKITLTSNSLKRKIKENALEFQNEVTKINICLNKNNKKTSNLMNQALSDSQRWKECFVQLENLVKFKPEEAVMNVTPNQPANEERVICPTKSLKRRKTKTNE